MLNSMKKFASLAALALVSAGCGNSSNPAGWVNPPQTGGCPTGTFWNGWGCSYIGGGGSNTSYLSYDNCSVVSVQPDGAGTKTVKSCPVGELRFPRLTSPSDIGSAWYGPLVKAGDVVTFRVHDSFFGLLDGGFSYSDHSLCLSDWTSGTHQMKGAVAGSYFNLPEGTPQQMVAEGRLYMGLNVTQNYNCVKTSGLELRISQCRTVGGVSYPCN
jgi:hypothetical protein